MTVLSVSNFVVFYLPVTLLIVTTSVLVNDVLVKSVTPSPTRSPTMLPTMTPTREPTFHPSFSPTLSPSTLAPTPFPTVSPTLHPTPQPTLEPTNVGETRRPTTSPTSYPTSSPTLTPTLSPTLPEPTPQPTKFPTLQPTTPEPTAFPTAFPTPFPTNAPTYNKNVLVSSVEIEGNGQGFYVTDTDTSWFQISRPLGEMGCWAYNCAHWWGFRYQSGTANGMDCNGAPVITMTNGQTGVCGTDRVIGAMRCEGGYCSHASMKCCKIKSGSSTLNCNRRSGYWRTEGTHLKCDSGDIAAGWRWESGSTAVGDLYCAHMDCSH